MVNLNLEKQGESMTFFGEADSTAPSVEVEVTLAPGAAGPPPHIHLKQTEKFLVVSGLMTATIDGQGHRVESGRTLLVKAGQAHTFANGSESEPLVVRVTVEPALHFQWLIAGMAQSAIRGGGSWNDISLLELGYLVYQVRDEFRDAAMPVVLQDIVFGFLARLAVILGKTKNISAKTN